eukprot:320391_1
MLVNKSMIWFIGVFFLMIVTLYVDELSIILSDQQINGIIIDTTSYKYKPKIQLRLVSTAEQIIQVINLINRKYNYKKQKKHVENEMVIPTQVAEQYQQAISYIDKNSTGHYQLDDNISFIIHNILGFGSFSSIYNVSVINNNITNDKIVLKYQQNVGYSSVYKTEYNLLTKMEKYTKYYHINSINIPLLHPIPLYITASNHCLLFTQQVPNAITWSDAFIFNAESILPVIIKNKGNIIKFLIDCFEDIMNVFEILWQLGIYYNDFHGKNLLIDTKTFQCYLVDFNYLFSERDLLSNR